MSYLEDKLEKEPINDTIVIRMVTGLTDTFFKTVQIAKKNGSSYRLIDTLAALNSFYFIILSRILSKQDDLAKDEIKKLAMHLFSNGIKNLGNEQEGA